MNIIKPHFEWVGGKAPDGVAIISRIAEMGRVAYQTEPGNRSDADFVRHLIARGHESVLEHAIVSVKIVCDRGVTHEEVRHRVASYTQESTRYCNYSKDKFGKSITYIDLDGGIKLCPVTSKLPPETIRAIWAEWWDACRDAEKHYMRMLELGASPRKIRAEQLHQDADRNDHEHPRMAALLPAPHRAGRSPSDARDVEYAAGLVQDVYSRCI